MYLAQYLMNFYWSILSAYQINAYVEGWIYFFSASAARFCFPQSILVLLNHFTIEGSICLSSASRRIQNFIMFKTFQYNIIAFVEVFTYVFSNSTRKLNVFKAFSSCQMSASVEGLMCFWGSKISSAKRLHLKFFLMFRS